MSFELREIMDIDSYKPVELKEMLAMALKNDRVYRIPHNAFTRTGELFSELILPFGVVPNNGNFLFDECPKFVFTSDKHTCVVTHQNMLFYDIVEQKVPQIYSIGVKRYLQLWVEKCGDLIDYSCDKWIAIKIKPVYEYRL